MSLDHVLLGLLREPQSGYDLKVFFDRSLSYFWPAELSQIYRILKRLEGEGLLKSRAEPSPKGPARRIYRLTPAGRRELRGWLAGEPKFGDERFTHLAQIFLMAECGDLNQTLRFVKQMRESFNARLSTYRRIEKEWRAHDPSFPDIDSDDGFHQHLTLRMGLHRMVASVKWCDETAQRIEKRIASQPPSGDHKHRRET